MAKVPESILLVWKKLEERKVRVPVEVWEAWEVCLAEVDGIVEVVAAANGGPVPVEDARAISTKVSIIHRFIRSIQKAPDGQSRVDDSGIFLDGNALELVVHYIGNDLYKIALAADVPAHNPQPLLAEDVRLIVENVRTIKEFIAQLKDRTA